jgi:hypothetical protein
MKLAGKAKRPAFHTMWMEQPLFRDWGSYLGQLYDTPPDNKQWKNTQGDAVRFSKVRWFNFGVGEDRHGKLVRHANQWYRYALDPQEPWKQIKLVRHNFVLDIDDAEFLLYPKQLTLDPKKVADLAKMKQWIPREFHSLYPDPPLPSKKSKQQKNKNNKDNSAMDDDDDDGEEEELASLSEATTDYSSSGLEDDVLDEDKDEGDSAYAAGDAYKASPVNADDGAADMSLDGSPED